MEGAFLAGFSAFLLAERTINALYWLLTQKSLPVGAGVYRALSELIPIANLVSYIGAIVLLFKASAEHTVKLAKRKRK